PLDADSNCAATVGASILPPNRAVDIASARAVRARVVASVVGGEANGKGLNVLGHWDRIDKRRLGLRDRSDCRQIEPNTDIVPLRRPLVIRDVSRTVRTHSKDLIGMPFG